MGGLNFRGAGPPQNCPQKTVALARGKLTIMNARLYKIPVRVLGVLAGLILLAFAIAAIFLRDINESKQEIAYSLLQGIYYLAIVICLFWPYKLIKTAKFAYWFFTIFLALTITFSISSIGFSPLYFGILLALIILGNAWIAFQRYEYLSGLNK